jgi:hypothetical protein
MLSAIKGLGAAGGIGVLIGVVLVSVIKPTANGGTAILIAIPIIICTIIGGFITAARGNMKDGDENDGTKDDKDGDDENG